MINKDIADAVFIHVSAPNKLRNQYWKGVVNGKDKNRFNKCF